MDDKSVDRILAYGCKGVIIAVLDILMNDMTEKAYIDMCGKIIDFLHSYTEEN